MASEWERAMERARELVAHRHSSPTMCSDVARAILEAQAEAYRNAAFSVSAVDDAERLDSRAYELEQASEQGEGAAKEGR